MPTASSTKVFNQRAYQKQRKVNLKLRGLCQDCGQNPPKEGKTLCQRCITNRTRAIQGLPRLRGTVKPHLNHLPGKPPMEDMERLERMMALIERLA